MKVGFGSTHYYSIDRGQRPSQAVKESAKNGLKAGMSVLNDAARLRTEGEGAIPGINPDKAKVEDAQRLAANLISSGAYHFSSLA